MEASEFLFKKPVSVGPHSCFEQNFLTCIRQDIPRNSCAQDHMNINIICYRHNTICNKLRQHNVVDAYPVSQRHLLQWKQSTDTGEHFDWRRIPWTRRLLSVAPRDRASFRSRCRRRSGGSRRTEACVHRRGRGETSVRRWNLNVWKMQLCIGSE